jgi:hypothetical protein
VAVRSLVIGEDELPVQQKSDFSRAFVGRQFSCGTGRGSELWIKGLWVRNPSGTPEKMGLTIQRVPFI